MKKIIHVILAFILVQFTGCKDHLLEMNVDPNGADPKTVHPNMVMTTVLTNVGKNHMSLHFDDIFAGLMQHTQKDGWGSAHNEYDWDGSQSWSHYYDMLRDNELVYKRSEELGYEIHKGIAITMRAMLFGFMTDLWGDVPYTSSLKADLGGNENTFPEFTKQEDVYRGVIQELKEANDILSKNRNDYSADPGSADVYYGGDPTKWRKLANSLLLRFYMRLSYKLPDFSKKGIEEIMNDPSKYPVIMDAKDDAMMGFPGTDPTASWITNIKFDSNMSGFRRIKMCATLVERLRTLSDPRLSVWAARVKTPIVIDPNAPQGTDIIVSGERIISPDKLASMNVKLEDINQNKDYIGLPPALEIPQGYNLSPSALQAADNPHVSWLNDIYTNTSHSLLKVRLMTASEVLFILSEAALKGWSVGASSKDYYEKALQASLTSWGIGGGDILAYMSQPSVVYKGSLEQLIDQKWIASWSAAGEAWFDYRRTGFPKLTPGVNAKGSVLPVRFYYMNDELNLNKENALKAIEGLEVTSYSNFGGDGKNSAWSKPWVLQGTGKPW